MTLVATEHGVGEAPDRLRAGAAPVRSSDARVAARSQAAAVWCMSPKSITAVTVPDSASTSVSVTSPCWTPDGRAPVAPRTGVTRAARSGNGPAAIPEPASTLASA